MHIDVKLEKKKRGTVKANGTGGSEMILTLLTEVVALHVGLTIIEVREPSFQLSFSVAGWLGLEGTNPCKLWSLPEGLPWNT